MYDCGVQMMYDGDVQLWCMLITLDDYVDDVRLWCIITFDDDGAYADNDNMMMMYGCDVWLWRMVIMCDNVCI